MQDCQYYLHASAVPEEKALEQPFHNLLYQKLLLDHVHDAVIGLDALLVINYWNRAAENLFGWKAEEVIGWKSREIIESDISNQQGVLDGGNWFSVESAANTKSGQTLFLRCTTAVLKDEKGRMLGYALTIHDLTEGKRREAELQQNEALRRSEATIQMSLAELRAIYANSPIGLCFFDKGLRYRAVNDMLAQMNGLPVAEHIGKTFREVIPPDVANATEPWLKQVLETGQPISQQEIISKTPKNGIHTAWLVNFHPVRDDTGEILGISCVVQDITEHKRSDEALRESQERYKRLFENHHSPMLLTNSAGQIIEANPAACDYYRCTHETLMAMNLSDIQLQAAELSGSPVEQDLAVAANTPYLTQHRLANGAIRDVEIHSGPITIGGQKFLFSIINDITERKKAEEEIRANRQDLTRAQAVAQTGSWRLDVHQDSLLWSDETYRMFAVPVGMPLRYEIFLSLIHPDDRDLVDQAWQAALRGELYDVEHRILAGDQVKWVRERAELEFDSQGKLLGGFGTVQDITLLKHTEAQLQAYAEKLERSNQELQQFAFVASHDLQEPLRKIRMFGNSLRKRMDKALPEDAEDYLNRMQNAAERMATMIDGLLELSRINTRTGNFEATNLTPIVNDVVSDLEARIQSTGGQVVIEDLPTAEVDMLQLRQLFLNLIGNALKFHKPDLPPMVHVSGRLHRTTNLPIAVITIEDNGIGFDEKYTERIFQPFQRLHGLSEYEGTGMGLAICQKIIERHQGKIHAQSKPGQGSTFIIHLPVKQGSV